MSEEEEEMPISEVSFKLLVGEMTIDEVKEDIRELLEVVDGNCKDVSKVSKSIERLRDIIRALDVDVVIDLFIDMSHNPITTAVQPFKHFNGIPGIVKGIKSPAKNYGGVVKWSNQDGSADNKSRALYSTTGAVPKGYTSSTTQAFQNCVTRCLTDTTKKIDAAKKLTGSLFR